MTTPDEKRYLAAAHALQTAVKLDHELGSTDGSAKHLRVGVNSVAVSEAAVVQLLVKKGVLSLAEYHAALADEMEAEVERYRVRLAERFPGVDLRFG